MTKVSRLQRVRDLLKAQVDAEFGKKAGAILIIIPPGEPPEIVTNLKDHSLKVILEKLVEHSDAFSTIPPLDYTSH